MPSQIPQNPNPRKGGGGSTRKKTSACQTLENLGEEGGEGERIRVAKGGNVGERRRETRCSTPRIYRVRGGGGGGGGDVFPKESAVCYRNTN